MKPPRCYIICTAPRSGSTLLCSLLAATKNAGDPSSSFYETSREAWREDLGVFGSFATASEEIRALFEAAIRMGRSQTDIFALRQQRASFAFFATQLAFLHPEAPGDLARIERVFGATRFIHLTRKDKLAQAVSLLRAEQSGLWHVAQDGSAYERTAPHRDPVYDKDRITARIAMLTRHDAEWRDWFAQQGITPLRLTYDALSADSGFVLRDVLTYLQLDPQHADEVMPALRKMADETSQNWIARYRSETELGAAR